MIIVLDANILFAALIKNSDSAKLMFMEELELSTPEFIVDEFLKYRELIMKKTKRSSDQFNEIMHILQEIINVIPKEEYSKFLETAQSISPDKKDIAYLALAMKLKCPIWSNDKKLSEQNAVKIYSTSELIKEKY